jgi:galactokinase
MLTYVREVTGLTAELGRVLSQGRPDYRQAGNLVTTAHDLLRDLVACSSPLLDACIMRVIRAGAYGAKLTGSGHGGCLFALAPDDAVSSVLASVADLPVHAVALPRSDPAGLTCRPDASREPHQRTSC